MQNYGYKKDSTIPTFSDFLIESKIDKVYSK